MEEKTVKTFEVPISKKRLDIVNFLYGIEDLQEYWDKGDCPVDAYEDDHETIIQFTTNDDLCFQLDLYSGQTNYWIEDTLYDNDGEPIDNWLCEHDIHDGDVFNYEVNGEIYKFIIKEVE